MSDIVPSVTNWDISREREDISQVMTVYAKLFKIKRTALYKTLSPSVMLFTRS
jgi:hypothetical protein